MIDALVILLVAALGAVGLTVVLRALPPFSGWNEKGVKPWSCDLCMSFWTTLIVLGIGWAAGRVDGQTAFFLWMPSFTVAYGIVQRIVPFPVGGPPIDPPGE